jgi:acyl-CoA reductase-like NAD-dependent aldehyde dehydrogenase
MAWMATWKFVALALKAQRGWKRIPPEQRRQIVENATRQARKHGPVVAKRAVEIARQVRKDH